MSDRRESMSRFEEPSAKDEAYICSSCGDEINEDEVTLDCFRSEQRCQECQEIFIEKQKELNHE